MACWIMESWSIGVLLRVGNNIIDAERFYNFDFAMNRKGTFLTNVSK